MNTPKKFIDFIITQKCSYRCEYCSQSKLQTKKHLDANKKTIQSFYKFLNKLDKDYEITITGGEAILHQDFFEIIEYIKKQDFKINLISNFSFPIEIYYKIFGLLDESLNRFDLSFHLDQITDFDKTLEKLCLFLDKKPKNTQTVLLIPKYNLNSEKEEKIQKLIKISEKYEISYDFQEIRILNKFQDKNVKPEKTYGSICYAGMYSAVIYENGDIYRCYSSRYLKTNYLGNLNNPKLKLSNIAKPCIMKICTCPKPKIYNQITKNKNYPLANLYFIANLINLPYFIFKNGTNLKSKFKQFLRISKSNFSLF